MSQYRTLVPMILPSGIYTEAGTTITDQGLSPDIPTNWVPPMGVDPIDSPAITAFWNAGPRTTDRNLVRAQWSTIVVAAPVVFWQQIGAVTYQLTGAGASLGPKSV